MKLYGKIVLLAAGVAVAGSAATVLAMQSMGVAHSGLISDSVIPTETTVAQPVAMHGFVNVSHTPTSDTDFTIAAEKAVGGVVSIKSFVSQRSGGYNQRGGNDFFSDPFFEYFFGPQQRQQPQQRRRQNDSDESQQRQAGLGSGVILTPDGYIVTNNHVIDGADRLEVTLNDNRSFNATVIGTDPDTDIALIKIDAKDLTVIPMGDSDRLKVGEWVLAVGNPFGFNSTVTTGIVSAKARSISEAANAGQKMGLDSYIQTDAAVNPGNSGGALVNLAGELVGINTAIYSQTGNYAGYSFAVPTTIVNKIVADIKEYGAVQRAVLGIRYGVLTPKLAKEKGITAVTEGLYVGEVIERGSAMEAGLKEGDVIVAINGVPTRNSAQMGEQINKYRPGDKITVTYIRDNKQHTATVTLLNSQGSTSVTKALTVNDLGCVFKKVSSETLSQLGLRDGIQVAQISSGKFKEAGVKEGFIVMSINGERVSSADDVERIYRQTMESGDEKVLFLTGVYPTGKKVYYAVDLTD